jgi:hypothetical protein
VQKVQGPTKKELLRDLESTGFEVSGFEGATKEAITRLIAIAQLITHLGAGEHLCPFF